MFIRSQEEQHITEYSNEVCNYIVALILIRCNVVVQQDGSGSSKARTQVFILIFCTSLLGLFSSSDGIGTFTYVESHEEQKDGDLSFQ